MRLLLSVRLHGEFGGQIVCKPKMKFEAVELDLVEEINVKEREGIVLFSGSCR